MRQFYLISFFTWAPRKTLRAFNTFAKVVYVATFRAHFIYFDLIQAAVSLWPWLNNPKALQAQKT